MKKIRITLATGVTLARGVLAGIVCILICYGQLSFALANFSLASATDFVDGYLARTRNEVTVFGAFLDTTVDKFLICGTLFFLGVRYSLHPIAIGLMIFREIGMIAIRAWADNRGISIPVGFSGKIKAWIQYIGIGFMFPCIEHGYLSEAHVILWMITVITLWSAAPYLKKFLSSYTS